MRLGGKAMQGYYPTPEPIIETLATYLNVFPNSTMHLLDNSAGTGRALSRLGSLLAKKEGYYSGGGRSWWAPPTRVVTYGIETNQARFQHLQAAITYALKADFFATQITNSAFQLLFCNPPYDLDYDAPKNENGTYQRLETTFFKRGTQKLREEGVAVLVIPQDQILAVAETLETSYQQIVCYRFPDDLWVSPEGKLAGKKPARMYTDYFKQVIILGIKRSIPQILSPDWKLGPVYRKYVEWQEAGEDLPVFVPGLSILPYQIPWGQTDKVQTFKAGSFEPDRLAEALSFTTTKKGSVVPAAGIWANEEYITDHWPDPGGRYLSFTDEVLAPLRNGHVAVLATAGIANGQELIGKNGRRFLIKGYSAKVTKHTMTEDEETEIETWRDYFATELWAVDLDTGGLVCVDTGTRSADIGAAYSFPYETMSMTTFLDLFGSSLGKEVARTNPSVYTGIEQIPWASARFRHLLRKPLGKQRDFILATVAGLVKGDQKHTIDRIGKIAGMGCGKTYAALASAYLADERRDCSTILLLCPSILGRKWCREAEATIPGIKTMLVRTLSTQKDVAELCAFDPTYQGGPISGVGCMQRVVARIQYERECWQQAMQHYHQEMRVWRAAKAEWNREVWWPWKEAGVQGEEPVWNEVPPEQPTKPWYLIALTSETAKLGLEWESVYTMKPLTYKDKEGHIQQMRAFSGEVMQVPHCTSCFSPLVKNKKGSAKLVTNLLARLTGGDPAQDTPEDEEDDESEDQSPFAVGYVSQKDLDERVPEKRKKFMCQVCKVPAYQQSGASRQDMDSLPLPGTSPSIAYVKSTAKRRFPLATYIRKQVPKGFFSLFIADEVHEGAYGTALSYARQELMQSCTRFLVLTGTLSRGKASDILDLLYHLNPAVRRDFEYNAKEQWIDLFGVRQKTRKTYKDDNEDARGSSSKRRIGRTTIEEKPGFTPQGLQYVLRMCGFLELRELGLMLPPYHEDIREVRMSPELTEAYRDFERKITSKLRQMLVKGDKSGLGPWYQALMSYPNMPYRGWTCSVKKSGVVMGRAPALPAEELTEKERAIIDHVQSKIKAGRRVLLYTQFTGKLDTMPRWKQVLEQYVKVGRPIKVGILYSDTVKTIDREEWIRQQVQNGIDVLICNPTLVQVGLDLIDFPSIVYESIPSSTPVFRQSSRRAYRPTQKQSCDVTVFVYPTMEMRLFKLMTQKMKISLMIEGSLPGEGLVTYGNEEEEDEGSMMLQLARSILQDMESGQEQQDMIAMAAELQEMAREIAQLDVEQSQVIGDTAIHDIEIEHFTVETLAPLIIESTAITDTSVPRPTDRPVTIITVPTSVLTDPWAKYRTEVARLEAEKNKRLRKKKKEVIPEGALTLF